MKTLSNIISRLLLFICCVALVFAVFVALSTKFHLPGGFQIYSVLTGSMEPAVPTGSLIIAKTPKDEQAISTGQIITFIQQGYENKYITHRIASVEERGDLRIFKTKGDANNNIDPWEVTYGSIKGVYQTHVPYVGSVLDFARSKWGIVLFVVIPVALLVLAELKNIFNILLEMKLEKERGNDEVKKRGEKIAVLLVFFLTLMTLRGTDALFMSNTVTLANNSLTTAGTSSPSAVTVRLQPEADTAIEQGSPEDNFGDSSEASVQSESGDNRRALFRFDLSVLPPDAVITSCNLNLFMDSAPSENRTHGVHRMTTFANDWAEGTGIGGSADPGESSWDWYANPNTWTTAGGDFNSTATATTATGTSGNTWLYWDVMSDCDALAKRSWLVKDAAENSATDEKADYSTKEASGTNEDPYLEVTFTSDPVTTSHLVINEVYYDVAIDKGLEGTNEWVEIYNPTGSSVDISSWKLCDASSCDTIPSSSPIPAGGFAVVSPNASTWGFWPGIPAPAIKIVLGSEIGGGLSNISDRVILKNASDTEIDAMSYGSDSYAFTPPLPDVSDGWSLARLVKGFDTDASSNFWANHNPNPGTNPHFDSLLGGLEPSFGSLLSSPSPSPSPSVTPSPVSVATPSASPSPPSTPEVSPSPAVSPLLPSPDTSVSPEPTPEVSPSPESSPSPTPTVEP